MSDQPREMMLQVEHSALVFSALLVTLLVTGILAANQRMWQ